MVGDRTYSKVGLETHDTPLSGRGFTLDGGPASECGTVELGLQEELSVEDAGGGIERSSGGGGVNVVGSSNRVTV